MPKLHILRPIKESTREFEVLERRIKRAFRRALYEPLLRELAFPSSKLKNSRSALLEAISQGRVVFGKGRFSGRFGAEISKELRALGARWDWRAATFRIEFGTIPADVRIAIGIAESEFQKRVVAVQERLSQNLPAEIAGTVKAGDIFDSSISKVERSLKDTLHGITVPPQLTEERRKRIVDEWQNKLEPWIRDFADEEIVKLRAAIAENALSGNRYDAIVKTIQRSFAITGSRARFIARQETQMLLTKFKEARYTDSGVDEYKWGCVAGSKAHPVRPSHRILQGKIFRWDTPPITTAPDEPARRNNPGTDYNCRCFALPVVRFK